MHKTTSGSSAPIVITGMPGVGKTALAVHWAHRVKSEFADGQLYVNLRGFAPRATAMTATDALIALLGALGVSPAAIPTEQTELEGLYRSLLADRRMLVLLDDAASIDHVVPLLPGSGNCAVLITSRDDLRGLTVLHDARRVVVRPLSLPDATTLLRDCIGDERVEAESRYLADLAHLCGYLPLALRIAAANVGSRPAASLRAVVQQLSVSADRAALELPGQGSLSVMTSFEVSFRALTEPSQRLVCLLSLVPGMDVSRASAIAVDGRPAAETIDTLDEITARHLLESADGVRFRQHDLLRRFAQDWAERDLADDERRTAKLRLYNHYLRSTDAAVGRLFDSERLFRTDPVPASAPREFNDDDSAMRFLSDEYANLMEAAKSAAEDGHPSFAFHIADALSAYLAACRPRSDWLLAASTGLEAAMCMGDRVAESAMRRSLALAYDGMGRQQDADHHRDEAIRISGASGDPRGEAAAVLVAGNQRVRRGQFAQAAISYRRAADLNQMINNWHGMAVALVNLSGVLLAEGHILNSIEHARMALHAFREISSNHGEFEALHLLGAAHAYRSELDDAIAYGRELLDKSTRVGAVRFEALAHIDLARAFLFAGEFQLALQHAEASTALSQELSDSLFLCTATILRADSLRELGRMRQSRADYEHALRTADEVSYREGMTNALLGLSALNRAVGDLESAAEDARRGHDVSVQSNMRLMEGFALAVRAEIDSLHGDEETAQTHAAQAQEILCEARRHSAWMRIDTPAARR